MKKYGKIDDNQHEIVAALRKVGASVTSLASMGNGVPDLLVGFREETTLMEIKDGNKPPSKRRLTPAEQKWHDNWHGGRLVVVENVAEALNSIGATHEHICV